MNNPDALLATDMDGTIIPAERRSVWEEDLAEFSRTVEANDNLHVAYVTGRDFQLALDGIEEHDLPEPNLLVCDVGTSLYRRGRGGYRVDQEYTRRMENALGSLEASTIRRHLDAVSDLAPQPEDRQTPFKVSYYIDADLDHPSVLEATRARLMTLERSVRIVYSVGTQNGIGLVDVLPAGVAKDAALRYLHCIAGVEAHRTVYAGDSGNDLAAFLAGFKSVIVGNAPDDLKEEVRRKGAEGGLTEKLFFSCRPYAGGVLEGCRHFGILRPK
jgi:sucrose-6F-phosphate phosphohydrolase